MDEGQSVHIFEYLDYRLLLGDLYRRRKAAGRGFSHRAFSRRAGLRSTNYLSLIIKGTRNLSPEMAERFAQGFSLSRREAEYFCALVAFNQARTAAERERHHERVLRLRGDRTVHQLSAAQADYHSRWYIPVVRELAARDDFREDPRWIARTLLPNITVAQARHALSVLVSLSLLERTDDGRLQRANELVTTGAGPLGHHIVAYHRAMLDCASRAIEQVPRDEREVSSVTLCVSHDKLLELKQRVREFRREILLLAEREGGAERVVQLNLQLFPLSHRRGKDE